MTTANRLRGRRGTPVLMEMAESYDDQTVAGARRTMEVYNSEELEQKLVMAEQELATVQADFEQHLGQARILAEQAKEEIEEQRRIARELEKDLEAEVCRRKGVQRELFEANGALNVTNEKWNADVDVIRLRMELDGLKQLEELRRQFDKERERYLEERDRDSTLIAELKRKLAAMECGAVGEMHGTGSDCSAVHGSLVHVEEKRSRLC